MVSRKSSYAALAAVTLAFTSGISFSQSSTGALVGVVKDATGAVIPKAPVVATNVATGVVYAGQSNDAGEYRISNLPNGVYDLTAKVAGFADAVVKGLGVSANSVQTRDVVLATASQATTVEVSSQASVAIDTTTAQIGSTFSMKEIDDLPSATLGLGVINLSLQAPGVTSSGGLGAGTGPSISGQRPRNNNFEIDGIDNNNKGVTGPLLFVPNDAVQEFTLLQNVYSAQYGHSSGGQFNTLIVDGTNSVHGVLYEYFQNRNLNAVTSTQDIANRGGLTDPVTGLPVSLHFNPRLDFNRYGGQLGGPVLKNKLFL